MEHPRKTVEHLLKISTTIRKFPGATHAEAETQASLSFVFGIAPQGLTPFEFQLAGKTVGEAFRVEPGEERWPDVFGHLWQFLPAPMQIEEGGYFEVEVLDIQESDQREIIRAMADTARCEDNCCGH